MKNISIIILAICVTVVIAMYVRTRLERNADLRRWRKTLKPGDQCQAYGMTYLISRIIKEENKVVVHGAYYPHRQAAYLLGEIYPVD